MEIKGKRFYLVGIKGTGLSAFAELLLNAGAYVAGSDVPEKFYTDQVLCSLGIKYNETFSAGNITDDIDCVVYSSAYDPAKNSELAEAVRRHIPIIQYTDALGEFSASFDSSGIAGVHGKTTTTALAGTVLKALDAPAAVLAGSAVSNFGNRSTMVNGSRFFVAETCEYKRHFMSFHPKRIIITSIEPDHLDFYPTYQDIFNAFLDYAMLLPAGGTLIYCADDAGCLELREKVAALRSDIKLLPYGKNADGRFRLTGSEVKNGRNCFSVSGFDREFAIRIPGEHIALDAVAALALAVSVTEDWKGTELSAADLDKIASGFESFRGSRRRSEIVGEAGGILFMDDYGHHPTAIRLTLEGIRKFYPDRRIVVDFMSHTYSRTAGLLDDFASSFDSADVVILNDIYSSAREKKEDSWKDLDERFFEKVRKNYPGAMYFHRPMDGFDALREFLRPGDVFITMGAGDNWTVGRKLFEYFEAEK
ncbi:MAG: UDP-N-acetylmuramate--L-alanine ligase [Spirochaetia bacterium]|nr:UDP-N-acetylmuramate--L-alanine ligase [Spirochaetia bacterium]